MLTSTSIDQHGQACQNMIDPIKNTEHPNTLFHIALSPAQSESDLAVKLHLCAAQFLKGCIFKPYESGSKAIFMNHFVSLNAAGDAPSIPFANSWTVFALASLECFTKCNNDPTTDQYMLCSSSNILI
jgi:hypothetical protein